MKAASTPAGGRARSVDAAEDAAAEGQPSDGFQVPQPLTQRYLLRYLYMRVCVYPYAYTYIHTHVYTRIHT